MIMSRKYIWHRMILYNPPCGTFEVHRYIPWSGNLPPTHLSFIFKGDSTPGLSIWLLVLERSKLRQYSWISLGRPCDLGRSFAHVISHSTSRAGPGCPLARPSSCDCNRSRVNGPKRVKILVQRLKYFSFKVVLAYWVSH